MGVTASGFMAAVTWSPIHDGVGTHNSYTATGLTNGTRYYFRVRAKNAAGVGAPSNVEDQIPRTVPSAPRTVTAIAGSGRVVLKWSSPASTGGAAITRYVIQRATSPTGPMGVPQHVNTGHREIAHRNRPPQRHPLLLPHRGRQRSGPGTVERDGQRRAAIAGTDGLNDNTRRSLGSERPSRR